MSEHSPFTLSAVEDGMPVLGNLPGEALFVLQGTDASTFLQGQTTADFSRVHPPCAIHGAFCDVKGRVMADFLALVVADDRIILRLTADLADLLEAHLAKYLMFSKASLHRLGYTPLGLIGLGAEALLAASHAPEAGQLIERSQGWLLGVETNVYLLIPDAENTGVTAADIGHGGAFLERWQAAACRRGEARISLATSGKYLPQDLNYDLSGWVSFDKGCYTGQEIIARLHWRGKPKRRLYRGFTEGPCPLPGAGLRQSDTDRPMGSIVNATVISDRVILLLETTADAAGSTLVIQETHQEVQVEEQTVSFSEMAGQQPE